MARRRHDLLPPPEMPARLRRFERADWDDAPSDDAPPYWGGDWARDQYGKARFQWCRENGVDFVDVLCRQRDERRAAARERYDGG